MARSVNANRPISHCPRGQGGRTFGRLVNRPKKDGNEAHLRGMRAKVQPYPLGKSKIKDGYYKYVPMGVELDKEGKPVDWP